MLHAPTANHGPPQSICPANLPGRCSDRQFNIASSTLQRPHGGAAAAGCKPPVGSGREWLWSVCPRDRKGAGGVEEVKQGRTLQQARSQLLAALSPLPGRDTCPLQQARGRVLAEPLVTTRAVPGFRASGMDGYALRAVDSRPGQPLPVWDAPPPERPMAVLCNPCRWCASSRGLWCPLALMQWCPRKTSNWCRESPPDP